MNRTVCLSFDVEEFDLPLEYGTAIDLGEQIEIGLEGFEVIRGLLNRWDIPCTLFCTAVIAGANPDVIHELAARHEIASHAWSHTTYEPCDAERSRRFLSEMAGSEVVGFRRPRLQPVDAATLVQAGYRYDSSLNPIWLPGRYNNRSRPRVPHSTGGLLEIPISTTPGFRLPLFWLSFKKIPLPLFQAWCASCLRSEGFVNLFFHPWEFLDLSEWKLPALVAKPCGRTLLERLERLIGWLGRRARFETFQTFARRIEPPR